MQITECQAYIKILIIIINNNKQKTNVIINVYNYKQKTLNIKWNYVAEIINKY